MTSVTASGVSATATAGAAAVSTKMNTVAIQSPARGGRATLRIFGNSGQIAVAANLPIANSDLSPTSNEAVTGCSITGLSWSVAGTGTITISRSVAAVGNSIVTLASTGLWNRSVGWQGNDEWAAANLVVTFSSGAVGVVFIETTKKYGEDPGAGS
jgi:hypothetical protein